MKKQVSVIMAAYNAAATIEESVGSIQAQTYPDWELIVCDDGSTDETAAILDRLAACDTRIRVIRNGTNRGLPASLNHCLQYAVGDYVARMDADDRSAPERLAVQAAFLDAHPDADVVGTGMICFDETGVTGCRMPPEHPGPEQLGPGVPFFHATIMMRRAVYLELGGYSLQPYVLRCEDVDLWFRFFGAGHTGVNIPRALYEVREDLSAARRRQFRYAVHVSRTLLHGYRTYGYPARQCLFALKPLLPALVPARLRAAINKRRWKKN